MGTRFKIVSDNAVKYCKSGKVGERSCHRCEAEDIDIYKYSGLEFSNGAQEEYDELCENCIKTSSVIPNYTFRWKNTLSLCKDKETSLQELSSSPNLPCFIQGFDIPVCCGNICEFIGIPQNHTIREEIAEKYKFWEKGFKEYKELYNFTPESEFLEDIGLFKCRSCHSEIFTFQFT